MRLNTIEKKSFLVGGAVRDKLLGIPTRDLDYVVIKSSKEELLSSGFIKVGKSFDVFLHPINKREYALPRGEDGTSIKEDLEARDLTINSMAIGPKDELLDPFNGQRDLSNKILRHTSDHFRDDPLRIFRVARFYANYEDFEIASETKSLMKEVSESSSFQAIPGERILKEIKKAFTSPRPGLFFDALKEAGCLKASFSSINQLVDVPQRADYHPEGCCYTHTMMVLNAARAMTDDFEVLLSALVHDLGKGLTPENILPRHIGHEVRGLKLVEEFCNQFKVSSYSSKLAYFTCKNHLKCHTIFQMKPTKIFRLLKEGEFKRRPKLIKDFITVCKADSMGKLNEGEYIQGKFLLECQDALINAKVQDIVEGVINEQTIERAYSKIVSNIKKKFQEI